MHKNYKIYKSKATAYTTNGQDQSSNDISLHTNGQEERPLKRCMDRLWQVFELDWIGTEIIPVDEDDLKNYWFIPRKDGEKVKLNFSIL